MGRRLIVREEIWDIGGGFSISRSRKWAAEVLMVEIHEGGLRGRGEGVPNRRQGEQLGAVAAQIAKVRDLVESGSLNRAGLQSLLPPRRRPQRPRLRPLGPGVETERHPGVDVGRAARA